MLGGGLTRCYEPKAGQVFPWEHPEIVAIILRVNRLAGGGEAAGCFKGSSGQATRNESNNPSSLEWAGMTLRLYDTAARRVRDFVPVTPGQVGIYLCGATVQSPPHLGHMRSAVSYDVLRRWLEHDGNRVTFIRNVTDIDDKILSKAPEHGIQWWALAYTHELAFADGYRTLGCLPPTYEPRATGHIPEMVELIQTLVERGHAYPAGGDVFFDVHSDPGYGGLSHQRLDNMRPAEDAEASVKRDPRDFALWKGHKATEPASAAWDTPWGRGRPGWHLECTAMAGKYLGPEFDIHGGGTDLIFPHHENEIAQARAAGRPFARFWTHHALVNLGGEKMSKSIGNVLALPAVFGQHRPIEVRYFLVAPHYRSVIDYSETALAEAAAGYRRIESFVQRALERVGEVGAPEPAPLPAQFTAAMNDDVGTPKAVAVLHDTVRDGNQALAAKPAEPVRAALASTLAMLDVLGLNPKSPQWSNAGADRATTVNALVELVMEQRQAARARKDYASSDALRDQLKQIGVVLEDTPGGGTRWTLAQ